VSARKKRERFERLMLPHLSAAYNHARWLVGDAHDAEDIVQTAYARAFEYFNSYQTGNSAAWILTIVRNQAYTWLSKKKQASNLVSFDEVVHSQQDVAGSPFPASLASNPELLARSSTETAALIGALERLPVEFREVLLLREVEGYSYKEIAEIVDVPQGTVMSRLSRARRHLLEYLTNRLKRENAGGL